MIFFSLYLVSKDSKISLMKIEEEPLFHVDEANPFLYDVIMDLREVKVISVLYGQYFLMSVDWS